MLRKLNDTAATQRDHLESYNNTHRNDSG